MLHRSRWGRLRSEFMPVFFLYFMTCVLAFLSAGCGGGGDGGSGPAATSTGEVTIGLTDAEGDFVTYSVDVLSIRLEKASGAVVETLPVRTRVDFARYTEMTEFVTAATIPSGIYTRATLRLDFSAADIRVEDAGGNAVSAVIRDRDGQPVTTMEMTVRLDDRRALVIAPGVPAHLTLDFNLKASNTVDMAANPPVVTVEPLLIAQVNEEEPKTHRVRGPLELVNTAASRFRVAIRPYHRLTGSFGSLSVQTDGDTVFEIDGVCYQGAAGLAALAAKPFGTATVAVGEFNTSLHRFMAAEVYAGSSVPFGTDDAVTGSVIARSGDTLTVRGATLVRADGTVIFNDTVSVTLAGSTLVTGQGTLGLVYTKDSVSVGQHVTALGTLSGAAGSYSLDASQGLVRMLASVLNGTVSGTGPASLTVALQTVNGRPVSLYDFTGTGGAPANDADPAAYQVDTGSLSLAGLSPGTPVRVRGLVRPFGQAPNDFTAWTAVDTASMPATLLWDWNPATASPFAGASPASLTLSAAGAGPLHHVFRGGVWTDVLPAEAVIEPYSGVFGLYAVGYRGTIQLYTDFGDYEAALTARLGSGQQARILGAYGAFEDASATLGAKTAFVLLQ